MVGLEDIECCELSLLVRVGHFENSHPTAQPSVVHAGRCSPLIVLRIHPLHRLEVSTAIKSSNYIQLPIDNTHTSATSSTIHCHHWAPLIGCGVIPIEA